LNQREIRCGCQEDGLEEASIMEGGEGRREGVRGRSGRREGKEGGRNVPMAMATNIKKVVDNGFSKGLVTPSRPTDVIW